MKYISTTGKPFGTGEKSVNLRFLTQKVPLFDLKIIIGMIINIRNLKGEEYGKFDAVAGRQIP